MNAKVGKLGARVRKPAVRKNELTTPGERLLARLPATFTIREDFASSMNPPTEIQVDGRTVFSFGRGDARSFKGLLRAGLVAVERVDGVLVYGKVLP